MSKQDRQGVRTPTDLERKYNFGKSFAEVMGLAKDAQKTATEAKQTAQGTDAKLTHDEIFNLLTKNGTLQGLYRGDDGELYINAEYIKAGLLQADVIKLDHPNFDGVIEDVMASWDELNNFIEQCAINMAFHTQKNYGVILDLEDSTYALLSIAKGVNGDGFPCFVVALTTGQTTMHRYGLAETYDLATGELDDLYWYDWMGSLLPPTQDTYREYNIGNWKVRECSNGECELWTTITATVNMTTQWGGMYVANNGIPAQTYPIEFASRPIVQCTPAAQSASAFGIVAGTSVGTYAKSPSFSTFRGTSSSNVSVGVDLYVKGTLA